MKLSEAIRLGGMMKPQGRGSESLVSLDAPCALGGALQAIGKQDEGCKAMKENWPFTCQPAKCPCGVNHSRELQTWIGRLLFPAWDSISDIIVVLNDDHGWTRNQIADWVETVEPAEEVENKEVALPSGAHGEPRVAIR